MVAAEHDSTYPSTNPNPDGTGAVYVLSNQDTGNSVTVFARAADGGLTRSGTVPTGGLGAGNSINAQVTPLNSQGALALSEDRRFLFAVDAGSNEVSVLAVGKDTLTPVDRVSSAGVRPVSVTVHKNLVYVANNTDGTIAGFTVNTEGKLSPLEGSPYPLIGGANTVPAQVSFTPDGTQLIVTELAGNVIDVFPVDQYGRAGTPVKNVSNGQGPFGFTIAGKDLLIVSEATSNATSSYRIGSDGTLTVISGSVPSELAPCWAVTNSVTDPRYVYVTNATSGSISGYRIDDTGAVSLLNPDGHTAVLRDSRAALDSAVSESGDDQFLYVLTGGFNAASSAPILCAKMGLSAFRIETGGDLTALRGFGIADDDPAGLAPGAQGIVAI